MMSTRNVLYTALACTLTGCGLVAGGMDKSPGALSEAQTVATESTQGSGGTPVQAFQSSFYAFAQTNCAQCHGVSQSPLFAVSNVTTAYNNALSYVDFSNPANSLIVTYAGNGHCGVNACANNSSAALAAVNIWAAAVNSAGTSNPSPSNSPTGGGGGNSSGTLTNPSSAIAWTTQPMQIPSPLPSAGAKYAIMRWPLSSLSPGDASVAGDYFEVQIQYLTPTVYHVTLPKLASTTGLNVAGIHVMIKPSTQSGIGGEYPLGMGWNSINENIAASTIPNPLPTTSLNAPVLSTLAIPMPVLSSSDALTIGFESLSVSQSGTACKNLSGTNGFVTNVKPQMQSICFNCHLQGGEGYSSFPMVNNNDTQLCATSLQHVNLTNPSQSDIVLRPQGSGGHPTFNNFNPTPFIQWINTE